MRVLVLGATGNVGTAVLRRLAAERPLRNPRSIRERLIRARLARPTREAHWVCAATEENAARRDAGSREPGGGFATVSEPTASITAVARRVPAGDRQVGPPYDAVDAWLACDIGAPDSVAVLAEAMSGADAVVHLAWAIQPSHDEDLLARTNLEGSQHVADAAARAGVPHLVYLSSVGAYASGPKDRRVDENWPTTGVPTSSYSRHKAAVERIMDRLEEAEPAIAVTRFRPGLIFQGQAASEISRYFIGPLVPIRALRYVRPPVLPMDPRLQFQVVHADDVAEAVAAALHRRLGGGYGGGAFNLAAEPVVTPPDLAALLGARLLPVDAKILRAAAAATWRLHLQPTEPGWVDLALHAPLLDTERARRELDWKPGHEALATVEELLRGFAAGSGTNSPPLHGLG